MYTNLFRGVANGGVASGANRVADLLCFLDGGGSI